MRIRQICLIALPNMGDGAECGNIRQLGEEKGIRGNRQPQG